MTLALQLGRRFSLLGWLRVTARLTIMAVWLIGCIPAFYLLKLGTSRNPVPRLFLSGIARIAGVRIRTSGQKAQRGAFQLANHVSWIDIPALAAVTGSAFVGHDGLASMPLLKWLCAMNDTVFVARHNRSSVHGQVEQVRNALRDTGTLTIFPEGTTSDGSGLLAFKSSLLSALEPVPEGIAIQPVLLDYGPNAAEIAWIGEEHGLDNFLRILARRRPVDVTIRFLPELTGEHVRHRKAMAATARDAILRAMHG